MNAQLLAAYAVLSATLFKALLRKAKVIPAECARCGLVLERRELGGIVCSCDR